MISKSTLSGLRILIINDDSINSYGIKALERIANTITPDVWVVAPEVGQSGKSFSVTFDSVLRIHEVSPRKFSVQGTPADCVFLALGQILGDKKPDLVLSGINHGANVADFIGVSGTIGGAFAAASQNVKSIAVSQHFEGKNPTKFPLIDHFLPSIIKKLISLSWPEQVCMNVNFPEVSFGEVKGIKVADQGRMDVKWEVYKRADPVDHPYYWLHAVYKRKEEANSDVVLVESDGYITITPLQCRHQFSGCIKNLKELFTSNV
ncbi:MAG: 5'/3'-nucleotidase SurE [Holosporaceae bacterium]|jgi:5'-nucleotidase|nr:5'/3'-nucleotidase SurE [Holosporaceae bacterium]